jgi:threonyl-tRNA synthetase
LPKGTALRSRLEEFLKKEQLKRGYQPVITPHIGKKELYMTSGHWDKYGADSFQPIKTPRLDEEFLLKPMNCPHHCEIFGHKPRSYKELPVRIAEFGTVYRYEQTGELHGLTRVRCFTQDDAHLFCMPEQVEAEFINVVELTMLVLEKLGFDDYTAQISLRHQTDRSKYLGSEEVWNKAEQAIIDATKKVGLKTTIEYDEAAFYGPKLDFMVKDALGRKWQLGTVQVDYNLPERFKLEYIGPDNQPHRPVMIHRAPFGSMERFIGVLTEHCAGKFPLWLTPDQIAILPISERFTDYANDVLKQLNEKDIRGFVDERAETIGRKIRDAEMKRIPFLLIIGEKEVADGTISVRKQGDGDKGAMSIEDFSSYFNTLLV